MKKFKKLLAFGLALIMCLGMAVTASAEGTGTITVQGANNNDKYYLYKIFDATITGTTNMAYKTTTANDAFMKQQAGMTAGATSGEIKDGNDVLFTVVDNGGETYVNVGNADKAAVWVQNNIDSLKGTAVKDETATNKQVEFTGLDFGYYYVIAGTETGGSAVMLTSVNGDMTINEKHGIPGFGEDPDSGKSAGKETVDIGETITYTVNYKNALNYVNGKLILKYTIEDNLADGIELVDDSLKVYVTGDGVITGKNPISFTNTSETGGISGEIIWAISTDVNNKSDDVLNYPDAPSVITVVYDVLVTKDFTAGNEGVTNTVKIGYVTEKPEGDTTPDPDPEEKTETVYTGKVDISKVVRNSEGENTETPLNGAKFIIRKYVGEGQNAVAKYMTKTTDGEGKVTIGWSDSAEDTNIYEVTTGETGEDGKAVFEGMAAGTYELVETKAPDGYNLLKDGIEFTLAITETTNPDTREVTVTVDMEDSETVGNSAGSLLPSTGGIGTTIFYVVGGLLVAGAGVLLITKKRMKKEQ